MIYISKSIPKMCFICICISLYSRKLFWHLITNLMKTCAISNKDKQKAKEQLHTRYIVVRHPFTPLPSSLPIWRIFQFQSLLLSDQHNKGFTTIHPKTLHNEFFTGSTQTYHQVSFKSKLEPQWVLGSTQTFTPQWVFRLNSNLTTLTR